jgi:hypothetical protein
MNTGDHMDTDHDDEQRRRALALGDAHRSARACAAALAAAANGEPDAFMRDQLVSIEDAASHLARILQRLRGLQ